jgi:septum formation protein
VPFVVAPSDAEELERGDPVEVAVENARRKALAVEATWELGAADATGRSPRMLGVDTLVALDGTIYGKPRDEQHAKATLRALAGRTHQVVSGLALTPGPETAVAITDVTFRELDDGWIDWYVGIGEWRERAGGYAIQGRGAALVREIRGDYANVVGLPIAALIDLCSGIFPLTGG